MMGTARAQRRASAINVRRCNIEQASYRAKTVAGKDWKSAGVLQEADLNVEKGVGKG